tara:strand:+ start:9154 stop:9513 length:360 start_codon:yes stop_codon:yes gene_type:complete
MANELTAQLSLIGTAANFGDALALVAKEDLDVTKDVVGVSKIQLSTGDLTLASTSYGKSFIYLKNVDGSIDVNISFGSEGLVLKLGAGEFAFFPWSGVSNIVAAAASGTPFLEYAIFES